MKKKNPGKLTLRKTVITDLCKEYIAKVQGGDDSWIAPKCMSGPCGLPKLHPPTPSKPPHTLC